MHPPINQADCAPHRPWPWRRSLPSTYPFTHRGSSLVMTFLGLRELWVVFPSLHDTAKQKAPEPTFSQTMGNLSWFKETSAARRDSRFVTASLWGSEAFNGERFSPFFCHISQFPHNRWPSEIGHESSWFITRFEKCKWIQGPLSNIFRS